MIPAAPPSGTQPGALGKRYPDPIWSLQMSAAENPSITSPRVTVYTTPHCHWCRVAMRYMTDRGIPFAAADVTEDTGALREMVLMTGQRGVPVISVDGRAMVGWNPEEFERLLAGGAQRR